MKAFSEPCRKQIGRLASSFSLRRSGLDERDRDERSQTGILTSGFNLAPAFPVIGEDGSVASGSL
jgi:hypothetical protein